MAESGPALAQPGQRPPKRAKAATIERGLDLHADILLKYNLRLPQSFTPGAVQANRVALRVQDSICRAYVANAQHVYEVVLGADLAAAGASSEGPVVMGKEGVLVPMNAQVGHIRQLGPLSDLAAEVQGLYAGVHGGHHVLAAVDAAGNARLLASPLPSGGPASCTGGGRDGDEDRDGAGQYVMNLDARSRGECGWSGLAVRSLGTSGASGAGEGGEAAPGGGGGGPLHLDVAVARQRMRDVTVFRDGSQLRALHMMQGPTALAYLPPGPFGGCADASNGLLAVAEEHQVSLWDVRQGERGGCVQRLGVYGGGSPVYALSWVAGAGARQQGGGGEGMLAATGGERSVVMLEPRKWHVVTKWPGCVKYPATHLVPSAVAPDFVYVAGLDYECTAGRWDGSSGSSTGNANSTSGGHGRAMGPQHLLPPREQQQRATDPAAAAAAVTDDGREGGSRGGLSFRGDSKWLGLATQCLPPRAPGGGGDGAASSGRRELVAALSFSGHLFVLVASASPAEVLVSA